MRDRKRAEPDNTAVRVALWRALHVEIDPPPRVFEDDVGLKLAAPDAGRRGRPDMSPFTRSFRASIVARAVMPALGMCGIYRRLRLPNGYFAGRTDGLRPPNNTEEMLVATT